MPTNKELKQAIEEKGFAVPAHVSTNAQLVEYLSAAHNGYSQEELDEMFPPPHAGKTSLTPDEVAEMIAKALAEDRKKRPLPEGKIINVEKQREKPDKWNSRNAAPDDYLSEGFRVFHANFRHTFDKFIIDGRHVECPFSKLIVFDPYHGPETQGFGMAQNLLHLCLYTTYSRTEKEMFLKDARWGGEFWTSGSRENMSDELELSMLVAAISKQLEQSGQADLKTMCEGRDIQPTDIETMRAAIALHDAKATQKQRKIDAAGRTVSMEKESLLTPHG